MKEENEKSTLKKNLMGIYLSRYQGEAYRQFDINEEGRKFDIFRPFKFIWFILVVLWQVIFGRRD